MSKAGERIIAGLGGREHVSQVPAHVDVKAIRRRCLGAVKTLFLCACEEPPVPRQSNVMCRHLHQVHGVLPMRSIALVTRLTKQAVEEA